MKARTIFKFIYWHVIPIAIFGSAFYYVIQIDPVSRPLNYMEAALIYLVALLVGMVVHTLIGNKIFKEKMTLAVKMTTCILRKKHGYNYCAICPDGYTCASDVDKKK